MNAHDTNALARTILSIARSGAKAEPEFTRKLSFEEQTAMHATDPEKLTRYIDWLFDQSAPVTKRWALREFFGNRDLDREREEESGESFDRTFRQSGAESTNGRK